MSVYSLRNFISKYVINLFRSRSLVRSLAQSPFLYLSIYRSVFLFLPIFFLGLFLFPFCSRCLFSSHYATARRRILSFTRSPFHSLSFSLCVRCFARRTYVCVWIYMRCVYASSVPRSATPVHHGYIEYTTHHKYFNVYYSYDLCDCIFQRKIFKCDIKFSTLYRGGERKSNYQKKNTNNTKHMLHFTQSCKKM